MERVFGKSRLVLVQGDITRQAVDGIVNAANSSLMGGGGVDGAIHRAGGPQILEECKAIVAKSGRLPTGEAVATTGGNLPAKRVIHTVGPVWRGGGSREEELLRSAYQNSLRVAEGEGLRTLAFPSISTGASGYPLREGAAVALGAVGSHLARESGLEAVRFVLFSAGDLAVYEEALGRVHLG